MSTRQHAAPPSSVPAVPEPSLAERARTLISLNRIGSLSTHSRKFPGFPFGSIMPYATDADGRPVFFVSSMAMHTQNLASNRHASLLVAQAELDGDPLGAPRVTLLGSTVQVPALEVKEIYLARHENAKYRQEYTDFSFYRLEIGGVYFIGGFGVMGWVSAEEYGAASPDPLAEFAPRIIEHMNADHADALVLIAKHFTGEPCEAASMTSVDRLGFQVRLKAGDRIYGRRISFEHEVKNTAEARTMLVAMVEGARRADRNAHDNTAHDKTEGSAPRVPISSVT